ncbi:hypothetical protein QEZ52_05270 [Aliisedimentitalea scapharcae]|uniref:Uncharacterized protein n=1 Tax=Aliisedimentitalea scapharcae TaxID=1524259 RepID=A0ABZ2XVP4_9RHOB
MPKLILPVDVHGVALPFRAALPGVCGCGLGVASPMQGGGPQACPDRVRSMGGVA